LSGFVKISVCTTHIFQDLIVKVSNAPVSETKVSCARRIQEFHRFDLDF